MLIGQRSLNRLEVTRTQAGGSHFLEQLQRLCSSLKHDGSAIRTREQGPYDSNSGPNDLGNE
jgi:hypothetical protein